MSALVFVYGTLKEGFPNFFLNRGRRIAGTFRTKVPLPLYVVQLPNEDRAPWLVDCPGEGLRVSGQVFEIDDATLLSMDSFEEVGLPTGYVRAEVELESTDDSSTSVRAYSYLKRRDQLAHCLSREGPFEEYTLELAIGYRLVKA